MLEGACKVRAMHACGARQLIDARTRRILEQTFARLREPIWRRAPQRFALDVGDQVLNAVAHVHVGRDPLRQNPFQQHALRHGEVAMNPAAGGPARHDVFDVDGENQRALRSEFDLMPGLVRTQTQLRSEADLVAPCAQLADAAADDDRHMRIPMRVRGLSQPRRIEPKPGVRSGSGQRQGSDWQTHATAT
jgi:hypothetical protein